MKKILPFVALLFACGLIQAQNAPATSNTGKGNTTSVAPAPAGNARGTRGKSTPIIAKSAQNNAGTPTQADPKADLKQGKADTPAKEAEVTGGKSGK